MRTVPSHLRISSFLRTSKLFFQSHYFEVAIGCLLVIGFLFQLFPVATRKFTTDELATYAFATAPQDWTEQILHPSDDRPPLFYLFAQVCLLVTQNEFLLRLPGILCSLIAVYILYRTFKPYGKEVTWIIVFLFTFSVLRMEQSWQFRDYSLLTLALASVLYFFTRFIEQVYETHLYNKRYIYGLTLSVFFGCMVNYIFSLFTISVISFLILTLCIYWRQQKEKLKWRFLSEIVALQIPLALLLVTYIPHQIEPFKTSSYWIKVVEPYAYFLLNAVFTGLSSNYYRLYKIEPIILPGYIIITVCLVGFFLLCWYFIKKDGYKEKLVIKTLFYSGLYIYIVTIGVTLITEKILGSNMFLVRTFFCAGAGLLLSFGIGIYILLTRVVKRHFVPVCIYFVSFVYFCIFCLLYIDNFKPSQYNLKAAISELDGLQIIDNAIQPEDQIIYLPSNLHVLYPTYYWRESPEKFSHMKLFMTLYGDEIEKFPLQYKTQLLTHMNKVQNVPFNEREGKIYLLNWDISGPLYDRIENYCEEKKGTGFKIIYKQKDRLYYVAVCE